MRIKHKDISKVREELLIKQDHKCLICGFDLSISDNKNKHLDHNHKTGYIRSVLCRRCNCLQGKIENMYNRYTPIDIKSDTDKRNLYKGLLLYLDIIPTDYIHPLYKTNDEKRILRNKRAREKRKKK